MNKDESIDDMITDRGKPALEYVYFVNLVKACVCFGFLDTSVIA